MRSFKFFFFGLIVLSVAGAPASQSFAAVSRSDRIAAQKQVNKGLRFEKKKQWEKALGYFEKANDLRSTPTSLYHMGKCLQHLGRLLEARAYLQSVIDNKMGTYHQRKKVKALLKEVDDAIPRLTIQVPDGFDGSVKLDGSVLDAADYGQPKDVDPGERTIEAEADGFEPYSKRISLGEGDEQVVNIELVKAHKQKKEDSEDSDKASSGSFLGGKTLAYATLAVGGVGVIAGSYFGLQAKSTRDELRDACGGDVCPEDKRDLYDQGTSQATYSTVGFIIGGVGLGAGAYLLLTAPDSKKDKKGREVSGVRVSPVVGVGSVGFQGTF